MKRIVLVLCLLALAGCQRKKQLEVREEEPPAGRPYPVVTAADITEVRIEVAGKPTVVLRRDGERWLTAEPEPGPVDDAAITFALREIARIEFDPEPVGERADWERLGVTDAEVATLRVTAAGPPLPALHLGPRRHLRVGDRPEVWRAHQIDHFTFNRELRLWR